jgi:hypothetical protein
MGRRRRGHGGIHLVQRGRILDYTRSTRQGTKGTVGYTMLPTNSCNKWYFRTKPTSTNKMKEEQRFEKHRKETSRH